MSMRTIIWRRLRGLWLLLALLLIFLLLTATFSSLRAQEVGDAVTGHRLAQTWCVSCHVVDSGQQSGASTGAPSFPAIGRDSAVTAMSLRVFLQTPHDRLPDLHPGRNEIDDVSAYILSFRHR